MGKNNYTPYFSCVIHTIGNYFDSLLAILPRFNHQVELPKDTIPKEPTLEELRQRIEKADRMILEGLAKRIKACGELGEFKRVYNVPVPDWKRELEVEKEWVKIINPSQNRLLVYVQQMCRLVIEMSKVIQEDKQIKDYNPK